MSRRAYPASPPIYQDPELLAQKVARTDSALSSWRGISDVRRQEYRDAQARTLQELRYRRRRVALAALALGTVSSTTAAALLWWSGVLQPQPLGTMATVAEAVAVPQVQVVRSVVEAPIPQRVVSEAPAPEALVVAPLISGEPAEEAPAPAVDAVFQPGTARVWREDGHLWAAFDTTSTASVQLRYLDGNGVEALEPMGCPRKMVDGVRHCSAGRTDERLARALEVGAAPGSWTVQGCVDWTCVEVGRFDLP